MGNLIEAFWLLFLFPTLPHLSPVHNLLPTALCLLCWLRSVWLLQGSLAPYWTDAELPAPCPVCTICLSFSSRSPIFHAFSCLLTMLSPPGLVPAPY